MNTFPLKKNNFKSEYVKAKNINYDFSLNQEIYNLKNIHVKLINIIMCKIFWNELFSIKKKNKIKKIINEIKIDIETKRLIKKKIESRKCVSEKIERNKALNNMKEIIVKEYFN